jgi:hypothetical protein
MVEQLKNKWQQSIPEWVKVVTPLLFGLLSMTWWLSAQNTAIDKRLAGIEAKQQEMSQTYVKENNEIFLFGQRIGIIETYLHYQEDRHGHSGEFPLPVIELPAN